MKLRNKIYILLFIFITLFSINAIKVRAKDESKVLYCKYNLETDLPITSSPETIYIGHRIGHMVPSTLRPLFEIYIGGINPENIVADEIEFTNYSGMFPDIYTGKDDNMICYKYLFHNPKSSYESKDSYHIDKDISGQYKNWDKYVLEGETESFKYQTNQDNKYCYFGPNKEVRVSIDDKLNIVGETTFNCSSGYCKQWVYETEDGKYLSNKLRTGICPKYVIWADRVSNTYLHFGESREDIISRFGIKEDKIKKEFSENSEESTLLNGEEQQQEAKDDKERLTQLVEDELVNLQKQYDDNDCKNNSNSDVCKDIIKELKQKIQEASDLQEKLEDNQYAASLSGYKDLLKELEELFSTFKSLGFSVSRYSGSDLECTDLESFGKILLDVLKAIRVIAIVLFIVLGALDFIKATVSSDQDLMKKATSNFIKRGIAFVILFLLPIILNIILKFADINAEDPLCNDIIKFW